MTPEEITELRKLLTELRRGMLQLERGYQNIAKYLNICYNNKEYLSIDETTTVVDTTE